MGTAAIPKNHETDVAKLFENMKKFDSSILMTKTMDGMDHMHGRPMAIAAIDDGAAWFFTAIESNKVREAQTDSEGYLVCQDKGRQLVARGVISMTKDRARIDKYWTKETEAWFPDGGKDDPSVCLMKLEPREGEYWDMTGTKGVKYLFETAKALVTGTRPKLGGEEMHGKVTI